MRNCLLVSSQQDLPLLKGSNQGVIDAGDRQVHALWAQGPGDTRGRNRLQSCALGLGSQALQEQVSCEFPSPTTASFPGTWDF